MKIDPMMNEQTEPSTPNSSANTSQISTHNVVDTNASNDPDTDTPSSSTSRVSNSNTSTSINSTKIPLMLRRVLPHNKAGLNE